jgi:nicotinamidase-related amidase
VLPVKGTALVLIDVINDLDFPGSAALVAQAEPMAVRLAVFKRRATRAGVPAIYVNDNFGRWRSDFRQTVAHCVSPSSPGRHVSSRLRPTARDYFVLKPKHSGFFATTLAPLLEALEIRRLVLTGIAGDICVLFTAADAYMRDYELFVPADCTVSNTAADNARALRQIGTVLKGHLAPSTALTFRPARRSGGRRPRGR